MRSTRDLLRRRMHLMRQRSERLAHIQNTNHQYNLPPIGKKIAYKSNRGGVAERFADAGVREIVRLDLELIGQYDRLLTDLELQIVKRAKQHDAQAFHRLRTVPGIGKILALVILYEVHDIRRFPSVQNFVSYARLVKPKKESAGKVSGSGGAKIGNANLKWASSEAAVLLAGLRFEYRTVFRSFCQVVAVSEERR
jgi:transposase